MLDTHTLERRWLKYKFKHYLPHIIISILSAISIIIFFLFSTSSSDKKQPQVIITKPKVTKIAIKPVETKPNDNMILEPSMQFIESISPDIKEAPIPQPVAAVNTKKVNVQQKVFTPVVTTPVPQNTIISPPPVKPLLSPASIKRDTATFDVHEIEERFKNNSNPHLGLYIARYHYDHGNYNEAYNYALKTNAIDSSIEESWLIFSKSLVKLGKSDQAKKTLQLYVSQTNSENAKSLLDSLNKDNSK
ncbi:MAG: hypothetical protein PHW18_04995 [Sulfuricurvum sp.]|uniref:tetratricopeptide repeat protein n=1 Tax=Sulfuricurvum sp. TaxID=2025608 RepID=UPI0026102C66|nr:hypothetical protein [Sulfuricurvum sp.]MDD2828911.1 hypothetical protein [Sulfuricurvum sp.]MDD4948574.1 hypothetical protein [Sulfuricurvum sp.]